MTFAGVLQAVWPPSCRQLLVVEADSYSSSKADFRLYHYSDSKRSWENVKRCQAAIGRHGLTTDKREGDGKTPIGLFPMGTGFGTKSAPQPLSWPYKQVGSHDYWVDDAKSPDYNQWVHYTGDPMLRWGSYERLAIPPYAYAAVIRYNEDPIVAGRGSAIFFHIWGEPDSSSAGCVTVDSRDMVQALQWMDPQLNPHMAIGTSVELSRLVPILYSQ